MVPWPLHVGRDRRRPGRRDARDVPRGRDQRAKHARRAPRLRGPRVAEPEPAIDRRPAPAPSTTAATATATALGPAAHAARRARRRRERAEARGGERAAERLERKPARERRPLAAAPAVPIPLALLERAAHGGRRLGVRVRVRVVVQREQRREHAGPKRAPRRRIRRLRARARLDVARRVLRARAPVLPAALRAEPERAEAEQAALVRADDLGCARVGVALRVAAGEPRALVAVDVVLARDVVLRGRAAGGGGGADVRGGGGGDV